MTNLVLLGRKMTENNGGLSIAVMAEKACGTKKELKTEDEKQFMQPEMQGTR